MKKEYHVFKKNSGNVCHSVFSTGHWSLEKALEEANQLAYRSQVSTTYIVAEVIPLKEIKTTVKRDFVVKEIT